MFCRVSPNKCELFWRFSCTKFSFTSNQGSSHILGYVAFVFRCTDQHEANELKILTFSLVYQISDRWKVDLDGLELRAEPPVGKRGVVKN